MSSSNSEKKDPKWWKAEFLATPSISRRKCIADVYGAPYEDTSTLVLTAPSGKFVDIRFPLYALYEGVKLVPWKSHPSFWAFSGETTTTFYDPSDPDFARFPFTAHCTFKHDIDTKGPGITDEGDCFLLPNGEVMEVGVWAHNGQLYKELWSEVKKDYTELPALKKPAIVFETIKAVDGRGIMIRVGDHIQGIFENTKSSDPLKRILVVRTTKSFSGDSWYREKQSDEDYLSLPTRLLQNDSGHMRGHVFEFGSNVWKITEYEE